MDVSIIIVSWNVCEKLKENLKSLLAGQGDVRFEIFVVDNNSADGSADMVAREFPQVKLIANKENFGFARANNQAIKQAQGEFVLLLNPDMRVFPDTLANMIDWMKKNQQASVAGCHLVNEKKETINHVRRFPKLIDQLVIILKLPHIFPNILNDYLTKKFDYKTASKVDSIRGSFFMIRRDMVEKTGGLDERYFVWFEEVDFCRQVHKFGGEVWYTPVAECFDYIGQSFEQVKRGQTQRYFRDSMLKYFKKWHPLWQYWILRMAWIFGIGLSWVGEKVNMKKRGDT